MVPFDTEDLNGVVYVWCGSKAEHEDASLTEEIAYLMYKVFEICQNNIENFVRLVNNVIILYKFYGENS
jgi:hypothetical protein